MTTQVGNKLLKGSANETKQGSKIAKEGLIIDGIKKAEQSINTRAMGSPFSAGVYLCLALYQQDLQHRYICVSYLVTTSSGIYLCFTLYQQHLQYRYVSVSHLVSTSSVQVIYIFFLPCTNIFFSTGIYL